MATALRRLSDIFSLQVRSKFSTTWYLCVELKRKETVCRLKEYLSQLLPVSKATVFITCFIFKVSKRDQ